MRARDLAKYRQKLLEEKERMVKSIKRHQDALDHQENVDGMAHSNHMADQGTDEFRQEQMIGLMQSENRYLYRIDDALNRIEDGSYGTCELCETTINSERLEALPYTRMCIECAEKEDAKRG
jgi:RNA polymerase-binding protein DksA